MFDSAAEFVGHQGWLDSIPKTDEISRREFYKDSYLTKAQPEEYALWLIRLSMECGWISSGGMGLSSLSWQEIQAWQSVTFNHNIWTARSIKKLSECYINEFRLGTDPTRPSPLQQYIDKVEQRKKVSNQLKNIFGKSK